MRQRRIADEPRHVEAARWPRNESHAPFSVPRRVRGQVGERGPRTGREVQRRGRVAVGEPLRRAHQTGRDVIDVREVEHAMRPVHARDPAERGRPRERRHDSIEVVGGVAVDVRQADRGGAQAGFGHAPDQRLAVPLGSGVVVQRLQRCVLAHG